MSGVIPKFPGFKSGNELAQALNLPNNGHLKTFAQRFFIQVSEANSGEAYERFVAKNRIFFDAMAQILTGDETCAAIALSGRDILIATNKGNQDRRTVSYHLDITVIDKNALALRLGITCLIIAATGERIEKQSTPVVYCKSANGEGMLHEGEKVHCFVFSKGEFSYLPDDEIGITYTFKERWDTTSFCQLLTLPKGETFPFTKPVVACRGALKRRAAKLLTMLSLPAKAILSSRDYLPQTCQPRYRRYVTYVEGKYQQYKSTASNPSLKDFLDSSISWNCAEKLKLDQGGDTKEQFLAAAEDHYKARERTEQTLSYQETHPRWVVLLNDTLTYELAKDPRFSSAIMLDSPSSPGIKVMETFYENLIAHLNVYQEQHEVLMSAPVITDWFNTITEDLPFIPDFIRSNFKRFHTLASRYFIQLAFMEQYIRENAEAGGLLANRISQEDIFKDPEVIIVDGEEDVHAEMRLFSHHLLENKPAADYYGIAMLCCALCHHTLQQFAAHGQRIPERRGTHANLYSWPLPSALKEDAHFRTFLGEDLFKHYVGLPESTRAFQNKKTLYNSQQVYKAVVRQLGMLNSKKNLRAIGLSEHLLIQGSKSWFPNNERPEPLPQDNPKFQYEALLNQFLETHSNEESPCLFTPLRELGMAWIERKQNRHALYYLDWSARIFNRFEEELSQPDAKKAAGNVFNVLGNVQRTLKQYEAASISFDKALSIKKNVYGSSYIEIAKTLNNLGLLHYEQGNYTQSYRFFSQGLEIAEQSENNGQMLQTLRKNMTRLNWEIERAFSKPTEEKKSR